MSMIPAAMYKYLTENCPGLELVDAGESVDRIKAIKSPEEILKLRECIKIHDILAAAATI